MAVRVTRCDVTHSQGSGAVQKRNREKSFINVGRHKENNIKA